MKSASREAQRAANDLRSSGGNLYAQGQAHDNGGYLANGSAGVAGWLSPWGVVCARRLIFSVNFFRKF